MAEARPPRRNYFLNVITITDSAAKDPPIPQSSLAEDERTATAVLKFPGGSARVTFNKTGPPAGHVRIEKGGKVLVDADLIDRIDMSNQAFGTDFIKGRRK